VLGSVSPLPSYSLQVVQVVEDQNHLSHGACPPEVQDPWPGAATPGLEDQAALFKEHQPHDKPLPVESAY